MSRQRLFIVTALAGAVSVCATLAGCRAPPPPPPAGKEGVEVLLCDGKTKTVMPTGTPGTAIAGALMSQWLRNNPTKDWDVAEADAHTLVPAYDNASLVGDPQGATYGGVTKDDVALWKSESERFARAGSRVFHSADELGSTIGVSCDMCHPNGSNTHPETFPKYEPQVGRVTLLRDMINWCIEHPVKGKALAGDDPRMRALEAYILAQRSGVPLAYGKR